MYTNFNVLPNGNLCIELTDEGKEEIEDLWSNHPEWNDYDILRELIEHQLCNGWSWLNPEDVGALTEAPILSDGASYDDDGAMEVYGKVWWYPNYMVDELSVVLHDDGKLIFELAL